MAEDLFSSPRPDIRPQRRLYADVAVRQRGRAVGTFSYAVPASLRDRIAPGQLVWVPFRESRLPAIVVSLSDLAPEFDTREVLDLLDPRPVLTETQLDLARWMAAYYLCSPAEALFAMLPPGLLHRPRTSVALTEAGRERPPEGLSPASQQVIETLRSGGPEADAEDLGQILGQRGLGNTLNRLARRGWVTLRSYLEEPAARPHFEPFLVLTAPVEEVTRLREQLWSGRRSSGPARLLETLARAPGGTRSLISLRREFRVERRTVRLLEQEGLVRVEPEKRRLLLTTSEGQVSSFLREWGRRAPRQAALVRDLQDAGGTMPLEQVDSPLDVRRALRRRKLIREDRQPAQVRLCVLPEVALERAAALRRTLRDERQAGLLEALSEAENRALPIAALYRAVPGAGREDVAALIEAGVCREEEREVIRDPLMDQHFVPQVPPVLTEEQGHVWRKIYDAFGKGYHAFLLHGVTGSGKTEIYLRALGRALRDGRQAIVLVPEISLTTQTVQRFASRFPGQVTVLHSGLTVGERYDQWRRIRDGQVDVVIGPRSALFAPLPRLGLIIVDEEHEASYRQDDIAPRYHARETALSLARITGSVIILGSATPAVTSYTRARQGQHDLLELPHRIRVREGPSGARQALLDTPMPQVQVVDMRQELQAGNTSLFSRALQQALRSTLSAGEQAILFLNRRGAATFVMCRECGFVVRCPRCEVSFAYHAESDRLVCHRCGQQARSPQTCPACSSRRIRHFGAGTERVVAEALRLYPEARVLRWDSDTTRQRGAHQEIVDAFVQHEADFLVGTQMIAKGLDLPLVTLVGVVSADTVLHLPDFQSAERTFQLITQVIGRAGRREERGRAIIQTYHPEHYAIQAAARQDYQAFYRQEMAFRKRYGYPPLRQMARLLCSHRQELSCREEVGRVANLLQQRVRAVPGARIVGPAPAFVSKRRGLHRWQLILLAERVQPLLKGLKLPERCILDVDPVSTLT